MDGVRVLEVGIYAFAPAAGAIGRRFHVVRRQQRQPGDERRDMGVRSGIERRERLSRDQRNVGPAAARYRRFFPDSEKLLALGDFSFLALDPLAIRFIEGFGSIHWISAADYAPPANSLADVEADIVAHMNFEHVHNLRDYCRLVHGRNAEQAVMVGVDCDGFDVRADGQLLRFGFERPVTDAAEARASLVALTGASRAE